MDEVTRIASESVAAGATGEIVLAAKSLAPPDVDGVALESALEFFRGVKNGKLASKATIKAGLWFLYTVNELRPDTLEGIPSFSLRDESPEAIAQRGIDIINSLSPSTDGTASAVNFMLIMQIVQMVIALISKFKVGGGGNDGTIV